MNFLSAKYVKGIVLGLSFPKFVLLFILLTKYCRKIGYQQYCLSDLGQCYVAEEKMPFDDVLQCPMFSRDKNESYGSIFNTSKLFTHLINTKPETIKFLFWIYAFFDMTMLLLHSYVINSYEKIKKSSILILQFLGVPLVDYLIDIGCTATILIPLGPLFIFYGACMPPPKDAKFLAYSLKISTTVFVLTLISLIVIFQLMKKYNYGLQSETSQRNKCRKGSCISELIGGQAFLLICILFMNLIFVEIFLIPHYEWLNFAAIGIVDLQVGLKLVILLSEAKWSLWNLCIVHYSDYLPLNRAHII